MSLKPGIFNRHRIVQPSCINSRLSGRYVQFRWVERVIGVYSAPPPTMSPLLRLHNSIACSLWSECFFFGDMAVKGDQSSFGFRSGVRREISEVSEVSEAALQIPFQIMTAFTQLLLPLWGLRNPRMITWILPLSIQVRPMHRVYKKSSLALSMFLVTHSNHRKSERLSSQWRNSLQNATRFWRVKFFVAPRRLFRLLVIERTFLVGSCDRASLETMISTLFHWAAVSCYPLMNERIPKFNDDTETPLP
jgi:hypothetical protein